MVRLFGPLSIEEGARRLGPRRPRRCAAEAGPRDPARGARPSCARPTASPSSSGATSGRRTSPARSRRSSPCFAATSLRTANGHASSSSPSRRRTASRPSSLRSTSTASTSCWSAPVGEPTRLARASLEEALGLVRGEVLEDEPYATWALDLRGSYQGRVLGARLDAADAALAELDFGAALAHAEAAVALDRFSERAARAEMLALYALGRTARGARPLPRLPHAARRGARTRADRGDACARSGHHPPGGRPLAAPSSDPRARRDAAARAFRLLGRDDRARHARPQSVRGRSTGTSR